MKQSILSAAIDVAKRTDLLQARVSEIADATGTSVGTFYSHFESKEDLIVAVAVQSWRGRLAALQELASAELNATDELVAAAIGEFLYGIENPELFGAEQLATSDAVWRAARDTTGQELVGAHENLIAHLSTLARRAIDEGGFVSTEPADQHAQTIDRAVWVLVSGAGFVWGATSHLEELTDPIPDWFRRTLAALFVGLGWQSKNPADDVGRIAALCMERDRTATPTLSIQPPRRN